MEKAEAASVGKGWVGEGLGLRRRKDRLGVAPGGEAGSAGLGGAGTEPDFREHVLLGAHGVGLGRRAHLLLKEPLLVGLPDWLLPLLPQGLRELAHLSPCSLAASAACGAAFVGAAAAVGQGSPRPAGWNWLWLASPGPIPGPAPCCCCCNICCRLKMSRVRSMVL